MSTNDASNEKRLAFSFSKVKNTTHSTTKTTTTTNRKHHFNSQSEEEESDDKDLITIIEDKKVKSSKHVEKKPPVIPLIEKNKSLLSKDDLNAIQALINDSKKQSNINDLKRDDSIVIDALKKVVPTEVDITEDPNYEQINIEDFGLACLRGMGWSEKVGIGKTNRQCVTTTQPELRPRGLGLGASLNPSKKFKTNDSNDSKNKLSYVKGAYLKILNGKYKNDYAQLMGFDDGLNRILVKISSNDKIESLIISSTELVTKDDYEKRK